MNIAFAYNVKKNENYAVDAEQEDLEFDAMHVISGIETALKSLGHNVILIEADLNAFDNLRKHRDDIDLVFNIAEGLGGDARESQIPLFCEMLGIPYTHSSPTTHAIKLHKHITKQILKSAGVNVPESVVVTSTETQVNNLNFPLIVKPNKQGSSKGIFNDSVVNNHAELKKAVKRVLDKYDVEALVEEYIDGREFTVASIGTPPRVLPIIEQKFDFLPEGFNKVAGYELKWIYEEDLTDLTDGCVCPAEIDNELKEEIESTCHKVWEALEVKDAARIDYRLSKNNKLYFLEINTLPGINPDPTTISYLPYAARKAGLTFEQLANEIIESAVKRYNLNS